MLKVTNAKVCASIVLARSFLASIKGIASTERKSCGTNAKDSTRKLFDRVRRELRWRAVL